MSSSSHPEFYWIIYGLKQGDYYYITGDSENIVRNKATLLTRSNTVSLGNENLALLEELLKGSVSDFLEELDKISKLLEYNKAQPGVESDKRTLETAVGKLTSNVIKSQIQSGLAGGSYKRSLKHRPYPTKTSKLRQRGSRVSRHKRR